MDHSKIKDDFIRKNCSEGKGFIRTGNLVETSPNKENKKKGSTRKKKSKEDIAQSNQKIGSFFSKKGSGRKSRKVRKGYKRKVRARRTKSLKRFKKMEKKKSQRRLKRKKATRNSRIMNLRN